MKVEFETVEGNKHSIDIPDRLTDGSLPTFEINHTNEHFDVTVGILCPGSLRACLSIGVKHGSPEDIPSGSSDWLIRQPVRGFVEIS